MRRTGSWLILAMLCIGPMTVTGAECSGASTVVERSICADQGLAALDARLQTVMAEHKALKAVRVIGFDWQLDRRNTCTDRACLTAAYHAQIDWLASLVQPSEPVDRGAMFAGRAADDKGQTYALDTRVWNHFTVLEDASNVQLLAATAIDGVIHAFLYRPQVDGGTLYEYGDDRNGLQVVMQGIKIPVFVQEKGGEGQLAPQYRLLTGIADGVFYFSVADGKGLQRGYRYRIGSGKPPEGSQAMTNSPLYTNPYRMDMQLEAAEPGECCYGSERLLLSYNCTDPKTYRVLASYRDTVVEGENYARIFGEGGGMTQAQWNTQRPVLYFSTEREGKWQVWRVDVKERRVRLALDGMDAGTLFQPLNLGSREVLLYVADGRLTLAYSPAPGEPEAEPLPVQE